MSLSLGMWMRQPQHGLRVTVWLHDTVVGQRVHWRSARTVLVGASGEDAIPTPDGGPLAQAVFGPEQSVRLHSPLCGWSDQRLLPGETLDWVGEEGVRVRLDLVPKIHARKRGDGQGGDLPLLAFMLMLLVGLGQARLVLDHFQSSGMATARAEPDPEFLARLMERRLDGADQGVEPTAERPQHDASAPSLYMPAGNDGAFSRHGGGENSGEDVWRGPEPEDPEELALGEDPDELPRTPEGAPLIEDPLADPTRPGLQGLDEEDGALADAQFAEERTPLERFVGWGFKDWFDVKDARTEAQQEMAEQLAHARQQLRIDPDSPEALSVVGYYGYLAERRDISDAAWERVIELYPDSAAGYNNLALSYKRRGEYDQEEALYRTALALDPVNEHVLNNLAVNLAHQGRFDEAMAHMDQLDEIYGANPYADLHLAKILALKGERDRAYRALRRALAATESLDTFHHIEFRQDIRLEPAFDGLRSEARFARLLRKYYGKEADYLLVGRGPARRQGRVGSGNG